MEAFPVPLTKGGNGRKLPVNNGFVLLLPAVLPVSKKRIYLLTGFYTLHKPKGKKSEKPFATNNLSLLSFLSHPSSPPSSDGWRNRLMRFTDNH